MEFLKEHLSEDTYKLVVKELEGKEDKVKLANLKDGQYVGLEKFNTAEKAAKDLQAEVKTRDEQLTELKKSSGDAEEFKTQIETLEKANKDAQIEHSSKLAAQTKKNAISLAVSNSRPVDKNAARSIELLIDPEIVKFGDDGKAIGLNDQLATLKEESAYLFEGKPKSKDDGHNPAGEGDDADDDAELSDQELFDKRTAEKK